MRKGARCLPGTLSLPPWILKSTIQHRDLCIIQYDDLTACFKFLFDVYYHFIGSILATKRTFTGEIVIYEGQSKRSRKCGIAL
jgi:hypothetical protein